MHRLPNKILLVDDNEDYTFLIETLFKNQEVSIELKVAHTLEGAMDLLKTFVPAVILLDLHLGKNDGVDVIAAVRNDENSKDLPILFLTGDKRIEMTEEYKKIGVVDVIHKPRTNEEFIESRKNVWGKYKNIDP